MKQSSSSFQLSYSHNIYGSTTYSKVIRSEWKTVIENGEINPFDRKWSKDFLAFT
jgi:hypothetical protein